MKDYVEIGYLTKYDAFRVNRDQVMDLEIRFKIIQTSLILRQRLPKPYRLLNVFISFVTTVKIPSCTYYLKEAVIKIADVFVQFKEYHGNHKNFKSLYDFRGDCTGF